MHIHHDTVKHGCDHLDAVNRTWIYLKKRRIANSTPRFIIDPTNENTPVCDAVSRVAAAMVSKLRVHAAVNIIELFL
ncbi:hypothetical protein TNCV_1003021 [Trichonephila clavipes]|nr:hypothetical protein TNCV_1003021 [Trichonephila clavipes]